jgi:NAD+ synthase
MTIKDSLKIKQPEKVVGAISIFIKDSITKFNRDGGVIGISGGIDSALSAFLAVKAVGNKNVLAFFMPERDSSSQSGKSAKLIADTLNINFKRIDLTDVLDKIGVYKLVPSPRFIPRRIQEKYVLSKYKKFQDENETTFLKSLKGGEGIDELKRGIAYHRIKHRLRMVMWYYYAELYNYLVIGCCNKTEKLTGYFVKYGDSGSDIDPIAALYKTQVKELARFIGVPEQIIEKSPSPDLMPGMTDEFALQMKYENLDMILYGFEHKIPEAEIEKEAGVTPKDINYVKQLMDLSRHMRELPPSPDLKDLL